MFFLKGNTTVTYFLLLISHFIFQEITAQIVGGEDATIEEVPFIVSLRRNNQHFCGGSIISSRHILTAAHCLRENSDLSRLTVVAGSTRSFGDGGMVYTLSHVFIHPAFTNRASEYFRNDIAVMKLSRNIAFNRRSEKINLPSHNTRFGEIAAIAGWGYMSPAHEQIAPILQKAYTIVRSNPICSRRLRLPNELALINGQMCTIQERGIGICHKDSGGPLFANNVIIGIASFGVPCVHGLPDVFTRVFAYRSWIQRVMAS